MQEYPVAPRLSIGRPVAQVRRTAVSQRQPLVAHQQAPLSNTPPILGHLAGDICAPLSTLGLDLGTSTVYYICIDPRDTLSGSSGDAFQGCAQSRQRTGPMTTIGYARVSTTDQKTDSQVERLKAAGCEVIRQEKVSGRSREGRGELEIVMAFLRPGDQLVVVKLDRLGRSTRDVLNLVYELELRGASLRVLEPEVNTAGSMGRMVLTVLGMVAEMELGFIKERQRAGIEKAKAEGVYRGRPAKLDHEKIRKLKAEGMGATAIAEAVGCKRAMVYKVLKNSEAA